MKYSQFITAVLLIVGVYWVVAGRDRLESHTREPAPEPVAPVAAEPTRLAPPVPDCLRDDFGLPRRVLITSQGGRCSERPGGAESGLKLSFFQPYFVFETKEENHQPTCYRIGPEPHSRKIAGWVDARHVAAWPTNEAARLVAGSVVVYADPGPLETLIRGGTPTAEPLARAIARPGRRYMPWPITEVRRVEIHGQVHELARIRFLAESADAPGDAGAFTDPDAYSDQTIDRIKQDIAKVDLVFCVDNSESTGVYSDMIRAAIRDIADQLRNHDIQLGLYLYRDYRQGVSFPEGAVRCAFSLSSDMNGFLRTLGSVREANGDPGNWAEAGYDGLLAAIRETPWRGDREGHLTQRIVVMVSDNSYHEPGSSRNSRDIGLPEITAAAAERNVTVHGLCIRGAGGATEQARHRRQIDDIARATSGRMYPLARAARQTSTAELSNHIATVQSVVDAPCKKAAASRQVVEDLRAGHTADEIARRRNLAIYQVTDVMQLLEGAGYDLRKMAATGPAPAEGWVLCEFQGMTLLEREVYVSQGELDALMATINGLAAYQQESDFGEQVMRGGIWARTNPLVDFMSQDYPETLDAYLMARGIPAGPSSLLRKTPSEIRTMSDDERQRLRHRLINEFHKELDAIRRNESYWRSVGTQQYAWIPERLLP